MLVPVGKRIRRGDEGAEGAPTLRRKFDFEVALLEEPRRRGALSSGRNLPGACTARRLGRDALKSNWQDLPSDLFCKIISNENIAPNARLCCRQWRVSTSLALHTLRPRKAGAKDAILQKLPQIFPNLTALDLSLCEKLTPAGLEHLRRLPHLKSLDLSNCPFITARCIALIGKLSRLETLNLAGDRQLADQDLLGLSQTNQLAALTLTGCHRLTNQSWSLLTKLTNLKVLSLEGCPDVQISRWPFEGSLQGLQVLRGTYKGGENQDIWQLNRLTQLSLNWHFSTPNALLGRVDQLIHLRVLHLYNCPVHIHKDLSIIGKLPKLTNITLTGCEALNSQLSDALAQLAQLTQLKFRQKASQNPQRVNWPPLAQLAQLDWHGANRVSDGDFRSITALKALTSLRLQAFQSITNAAFTALGKLKKLKQLQLNFFWLSRAKSLNALSELQALRVLVFRSFGAWGNWQLTSLSRLSYLQRLSFCDCAISNNQIVQISHLTGLRSLTLSHCTKIKPENFWTLSSLTRCTQLQLEGFGQIEGWHLQAFANLRLNFLSLYQTPSLNNRALKALTEFKQLKWLNLGSCRGFSARGLFALNALNSLKSIDVRNTQLNDSDLKALAHLLELEEIQLGANTHITLNGLRHLTKLRHLRTLNVGKNWTLDSESAGLSHIFIARSAT